VNTILPSGQWASSVLGLFTVDVRLGEDLCDPPTRVGIEAPLDGHWMTVYS
jgi:hypothetical protein